MRNKTYIIAEIGNTHEGSVGLAKQFIKSAKDCGVDAVKLQTHIFSAESLDDAPNPPYFKDETRKEYFERTAFNLLQYKELVRYTEDICKIDFISSPFSHQAVDLLVKSGVNKLKIASGEVSNIPLLEYISNKNVEVILSSGMSSWDEIDKAVSVLKSSKNFSLLQCTSLYPCPPSMAGLNVIKEMKSRYNIKVGFSDHTSGYGVSIAAIMEGAEIIEKHFTLSKKMYGSDAKNSMEPDELELFVKNIREVDEARSNILNKDSKNSQLSEMKNIFEKSVVSLNDLKSGHKLTINDICFKKPGIGINASNYKKVIGMRIINDISSDQRILWDNLKK